MKKGENEKRSQKEKVGSNRWSTFHQDKSSSHHHHRPIIIIIIASPLSAFFAQT
jgi:hypothetical protein